MDFLETGLCACEAIGLDPDGHHDHIKRPPAYAGFRVARADAVASRGPTRPQLAAARARGTEKYIQYPYQNFKNRVLENRENELYADVMNRRLVVLSS